MAQGPCSDDLLPQKLSSWDEIWRRCSHPYPAYTQLFQPGCRILETILERHNGMGMTEDCSLQDMVMISLKQHSVSITNPNRPTQNNQAVYLNSRMIWAIISREGNVRPRRSFTDCMQPAAQSYQGIKLKDCQRPGHNLTRSLGHNQFCVVNGRCDHHVSSVPNVLSDFRDKVSSRFSNHIDIAIYVYRNERKNIIEKTHRPLEAPETVRLCFEKCCVPQKFLYVVSLPWDTSIIFVNIMVTMLSPQGPLPTVPHAGMAYAGKASEVL
ncbi:uncharacterized protein CLUP02_07605 [Colletotrichum lupini]|uniref:Uncharacterized protein n=1 Tax=Colletotrichum lupini TaxID=145971 RepID=A0A9Q8WG45_9PEZI|nr:uncharacterized protein CLUP02_07605 [Colletotrichum lupini]UQC82119.1 hypothetical protein CLUP02_07605 [Colletotrichum lupini]